jgi:hypothetical protein
LPSRARDGDFRGSPGIGLQAGEDGVADPPLEGPERFLVRLPLGQLLLVIGAAVAVPVPDLGDRGHGHVQRVTRDRPHASVQLGVQVLELVLDLGPGLARAFRLIRFPPAA